MKTPAGDVGWGRSGMFPLHSDDVIHLNYVLRCEDERIGILLFFVCCCWFDTRPKSPITRLMRSREGSWLDRASSRPRGRSVTGSVARLERGGTVKSTTLEAATSASRHNSRWSQNPSERGRICIAKWLVLKFDRLAAAITGEHHAESRNCGGPALTAVLGRGRCEVRRGSDAAA
jgi:hypothetical protein